MDVIRKDKLRDVFITKTAIKNNISEQTVEKVVSFICKKASEATKTHNEVELSGFGKFLFSKPRAKRKLESFKKLKANMEQRIIKYPNDKTLPTYVKIYTDFINLINDKLGDEIGNQENIGGDTEQSDTSKGVEEANRGSVDGTIIEMQAMSVQQYEG